MTERFPTEVRATASAFCYHLGTIAGGIVPPLITHFAVDYNLGFSIPMLVGRVIGGASWCLALFLGPETRGKEMVPDLVLA
jgi:SHS family lactate transporter-like MFS transporter